MMRFLQRISILCIVTSVYLCSSSMIFDESTKVSLLHKKAAPDVRLHQSLKSHDIISLNIGGELILTTRRTLTRIPKSTLAIMFKDTWESRLPKDRNGNIFLDCNPILFRHLLDQLQLSDTKQFYPPLEPSQVEPFKRMLRKLGLLKLIVLLEKNIVRINIGGQTFTHHRSTLTQMSNATVHLNSSSSHPRDNDVFIDSDPKLLEHLVEQLRELPMKNTSYLKTPSSKQANSFKKILNDLRVNQRTHSSLNINYNTTWVQNGSTIAGGIGKGEGLSQLNWPESVCVDDDQQTIYISDSDNHRIIEWKFDAYRGRIVAGGNGQGNRVDQLDYPTDVTVSKQNDSLVICDCRNRRVVQWHRQDNTNGHTIIFDIDCFGLAMDNNDDLYVSDLMKNEVRRWKIGDTKGVLVAGGNGEGNQLNQLYLPTAIFLDQNQSIYISDEKNHRVVKWIKYAKEGIVVAGGNDQGENSTQLSYPRGVIVDHFDNVYVADSRNNRVMRWSKDATEGSLVLGGNGQGKQSNQFHYPKGLAFDRQGNIYVADWDNNRVQKFDVNIN
ncbi:unnamed protein product [Adineta ricciae]|uniref:Potassium channel tetramerisation-type BTB domain-containing protein n=1 Tax=Adineta ricciae TaxID=249248 RepID=A0A815HHY4_ADIRI|nr:unnamed protein product [Adineta ricciae]